MKVLQTLGDSGRTGLPGSFYYRRTPDGLDIYNPDASSSSNPNLHVYNDKWNDILSSIKEHTSFTLSSQDSDSGLYGILKECGYSNTTDCARIAAILEHEGSIDLNGKGLSPINLVNDM